MIAPRDHDLFAAATSAFDRLDPVIGCYGRPGRALDVRIANSLPRRLQVMEMRDKHYRDTLTGLGVPVWDSYDEDAVQLLCTEDDRPVGSLRLTANTEHSGDLHDDFSGVRSVVAPGRFAVVGRALVVPEQRAHGVLTAVVHAACRWWLRHGDSARLVVTCLSATVPAAVAFGGRVLTEPLPLGPCGVPVVLVEVDARRAVDNGCRWLGQHGWSVA
ncbi:hypothetical protein [Kutzneria sp. NPDC051319]|uniref:hypothetical protein n=1 Tax=Kutzneria sp. NPDC051319 TaxID=3155047 RepID=UPI0034489DBF